MSSSNDPVSDFLAREQTALADLGEDFVAAPPPPPAQINDDGILLTNGGSDFSATANYGTAANYDAFDAPDDQPPVQNGFNGSLRGSPTLFSHSRSQSQQLEEEPEKIRKWREQQKEKIEEKDKIEEQKKDELREQAKKELEQFYAQKQNELEQRKKLNREREAALKAEQSPNTPQDAAMVWERVARMIEAGGGPGVTLGASIGSGGGAGKGAKGIGGAQCVASGGGKDTTRMKQLILAYARGDQQWGAKSPSPDKDATVDA